jgi:D-alanyl-D-alanine carboxypeptidase
MTPEQEIQTSRKRLILLQSLAIVALITVLSGPKVMEAIQKDAEPIRPSRDEVIASAHKVDPYTSVNISAKSAFVWDIAEHKKLFGKSEYERLPLASITKIMMALVAHESFPENTVVTILPEDLREDGDHGLRVGERWKIGDLISFALVSSSNDAASAIASIGAISGIPEKTSTQVKSEFIERMNAKARSIGLLDTTFSNETGLDIASYQSGAYGTARDMAMLYEYVWRKYPDLFSATSKPEISLTSSSGIVHHVANTNDTVGNIPGIIGSKTGYTDLAGGNLVIITDIGIARPIVISVLGSTREQRFVDVETLRQAAIRSITDSVE